METELGYLKESGKTMGQAGSSGQRRGKTPIDCQTISFGTEVFLWGGCTKKHRVQWEIVRLRWMGWITLDDLQKFQAESELYRNCVNNWTAKEQRRLLLAQLPSSLHPKIHKREEKISDKLPMANWEKSLTQSGQDLPPARRHLGSHGSNEYHMDTGIHSRPSQMWIIHCPNAHLQDVLNLWDGLDYQGFKLISHPHEAKKT